MIEIVLSVILVVSGVARVENVAHTSQVRSRRRIRTVAWGAEPPPSTRLVPAPSWPAWPALPEPTQSTPPPIGARRTRRVLTRTMALGLGVIVAAALITVTPQQASGWNQGSAEATLWRLLNGARENNGLAPLLPHGTLVGLARWRSSDMLAADYFSHTLAGCGCLVYAYYDSIGLAYEWAGENIGWNSGLGDAQSPVRVHEQFMASAGHRANVLDPRFTHGAVGAAAADGREFQGYVQDTRMYTELFMQAGGAPQPVSAGLSTPPAARAQPIPPAPKPHVVEVDVPRRPHSTAGMDRISTVVALPPVSDAAMVMAVVRPIFQSPDSSHGGPQVPTLN